MKQHVFFAFNQGGVQLRLGKRGAAQDMAQKLHIGGQAHNVRLRQGGIEARQSLFTGFAVHDQLGHHGVVIRADGVALANAVVNAHITLRKSAGVGLAVDVQAAGGRQELVVGIFSAQTRFDRMAMDAQIGLLQGQGLARSHPQLPFHQVQARDGLGHWVFHLQTGVHLHEEEVHAAR